ncbi:MAG: hypothetical protein K5859_03415 [Atopobiaceae bacterium]|nr:hypothetical protein [Atopobiaceae bacterium]
MADEFKAENDGFQYTPGDETYDPSAIDDVTDIFHDGYGADDDPTGDLSAPESREGGIGDAAATVQQTLAKAGGAAAGAARTATAAMAEGLTALKDVAAASREHSDAKALLREMETAFEADSETLQHRLDIESSFSRIVNEQTAELQDAQRVVAEATNTIETLSAQRDQLGNRLTALKGENEQMLRPYKALVDSTRKRSDDTSRTLGDARRAVKDAESQVEEANRRREQAVASANRALDSAQERLRQVQDELKAMQENPGSALSAIFDLKNEVAQETASVEAARVDVQTVTTDSQYAVESAQQQLFSLRQSVETAENDYETAKKEAEDRRTEYDRIHKDAMDKEEALQREIDARIGGIEEAQTMLRGAEERIKEAQSLLDEANGIHATPEVTEALIASVNQQHADIEQQNALIEQLATNEKSLRDSTRGKRVLFIGVIAAAVVLLIVILFLIFGPK